MPNPPPEQACLLGKNPAAAKRPKAQSEPYYFDSRRVVSGGTKSAPNADVVAIRKQFETCLSTPATLARPKLIDGQVPSSGVHKLESGAPSIETRGLLGRLSWAFAGPGPEGRPCTKVF